MAWKQITGKYVCEYARVVEVFGTNADGASLYISGHAIGQTVKNLKRGEEYIYDTGADSWIIFYVFDYTSGNFRARDGLDINDRNYIKLGPNSKLKITTAKGKSIFDWDGDDKTFELIKGTLWKDKEAATLKTVEDTIKTLVKTVSRGAIRTLVDGCRANASNNNDTLANLAITAVTTEAAISTFVLGLGGALVAIPAGAADMVAQWIFQAQVAYALGYVYGVYPQKEKQYENHLLILLAGQDALHDALKDDLNDLKKDSANPLKNGVVDIGVEYLEKKPELIPKIVAKCLSKLGKKYASFVEKLGKIVSGAVSWVPFAASVWGIASSGWNSIKFGGEAKNFYSKPLPKAAVTVKFDTAGGTPSVADKTVTGSAYGTLPIVSRPGYKFGGWYDAATGGTEVKATTKVPDKNHTLYARWTGNSIKVTFNSQGGSAPSPASKTLKVGDTYGAMPNVTRTGYNFNGWNFQAKGGAPVGPSSTITAIVDHTLYALWSTPGGITVTFDPNGGNASSTTRNITPGHTYGTLPSITKPGFRFDGWFTEAAGGTKIDEKSVFTGSTKTLYAQWKPLAPNSITITFDTNGGTPKPAPKVITIGSNYGELPTVSKAGCKFQCWSNDLGEVNAATKSIASSHTLYAIWDSK